MADFGPNVLAILKTWYDSQRVENLLFRNSPTLRRLSRMKFGGKYYPLPMMYARTGSVAGDYRKALAAAADGPKNVEAQVTAAQMFSVFTVSPKEYLASKEYKGAYMTVLAEKMFSSNEAMRKTLAASLFGTGCGETGLTASGAASNATTLTIDGRAAVTVDVNSQIYFIDSADPVTGNVVTTSATGYHSITSINVNSASPDGSAVIEITPAIANGATVNAGTMVMLYGCRAANKAPLLPTGLAGWLPTVNGRTGAAWDSYIATPFFNVNRAVYPTRLAGSFVQGVNGDKKKDNITTAVRAVRRNGGVPNLIVLNDVDYQSVMAEIGTSQNYWQQTAGADAGKEQTAVTGFGSLEWSFSTNFLKYTIDDPYCPKGTAYVLDESGIKFIALTNNEEQMDDGIADNQPGAPEASAQAEPTTQYQFLINDMLTVNPVDTDDGPGIAVTLQMFSQFILPNPAHHAVIRFAN
jgi:hypothetical protein